MRTNPFHRSSSSAAIPNSSFLCSAAVGDIGGRISSGCSAAHDRAALTRSCDSPSPVNVSVRLVARIFVLEPTSERLQYRQPAKFDVRFFAIASLSMVNTRLHIRKYTLSIINLVTAARFRVWWMRWWHQPDSSNSQFIRRATLTTPIFTVLRLLARRTNRSVCYPMP